MSEKSTFNTSIEFSEKQRVDANQEVLERVTRILFTIFMDDEPMSEDDINNLLEDCFGMASALMAVCGMRILGENENRDYVARFKPYRSLEHFTKEGDF